LQATISLVLFDKDSTVCFVEINLLIILMQKKEYYYFCEYLSDKIKKNILKFKVNNIIYYTNSFSYVEANKIKKFCLANKIKFFVIDNLLAAQKIKSYGIFLSSKNKLKCFIYKKFYIIGSAHNQLEYANKCRQKCNAIMLSPVFYNKKYSNNKLLGVNRFNLITKEWKTQIVALGGINQQTLQKTRMLKCSGLAFKNLVDNA
jgi:thiamine monophosphate synthase